MNAVTTKYKRPVIPKIDGPLNMLPNYGKSLASARSDN
jgi:hypothetical protein